MTTATQKQIEIGTFAQGEFLGFKAEAWRNDPSKYNHKVFVKIGERATAWGDSESDVVEIEVFGDVPLNFYRENQEKLIGSIVSIPMSIKLNSGTSKVTGQPYAFLKYSIKKDTLARVLRGRETKAAA